jgi:hypothetical protein
MGKGRRRTRAARLGGFPSLPLAFGGGWGVAVGGDSGQQTRDDLRL